MPAKNPYGEWLKQDLGALIDTLDISDLQKHILRSRWLEQVLWMEGRANSASWWYHRLRICTIVGSGLIPGLLSGLFLAEAYYPILQQPIHVGLLVISIMVAVLLGLEEFFHYGQRWRHYRQTVELLKSEGWQYIELGGAYHGNNHAATYDTFMSRVENILLHDVEGFITQVVAEKEGEKEKLRVM